MECSRESALSLFFKPWAESGVEILLSVNGAEEFCKIKWTSPGNCRFLEICFTRSGAKNLMVDLFEASGFSYEDARNDASVPLLAANGWESFVLVGFPDGATLLFARPRRD